MMKILFMMFFMIPLCFNKVSFWVYQYFYFILMFIFSLKISISSQYLYISYFLGCDLLSYMMILLSLWICSLMIMASEKLYYYGYYWNLFMLMLIFLLLCLFITFGTLNLFVFYLFFEMSLIPVFIMIMGWGYQPERLQAGVYLLFYTLFASLPMMVAIFYYYEKFNSLNFYFLSSLVDNSLIYMCMNMVFFIKMPMYFVHLWLPKAHVEAPVAGSMILAGIMLKLGGYGLMRLMMIFLKVGMKINLVFIIISMIGGFFVSLICLRQNDLKALIAYSSVAHMGLALGGIMTLSYWGLAGALVMMLAHGLCSSGLFCLANISYERLLSRSLFLNKGLLNLMPNITLWWFLFSCCNMAAPPSLNLLGEIMLINSLISWSWKLSLFIALMSFFSAAYSLYLYSYTQHGMIYSGKYTSLNGSVREYLLLLLHLFPLSFLVLKSEFMIYWV